MDNATPTIFHEKAKQTFQVINSNSSLKRWMAATLQSLTPIIGFTFAWRNPSPSPHF